MFVTHFRPREASLKARADQVRVAGLPAQVARGPLNSALTPIRRPVELGVDVIIERPTAS